MSLGPEDFIRLVALIEALGEVCPTLRLVVRLALLDVDAVCKSDVVRLSGSYSLTPLAVALGLGFLKRHRTEGNVRVYTVDEELLWLRKVVQTVVAYDPQLYRHFRRMYVTRIRKVLKILEKQGRKRYLQREEK